GTGTIDNGGSFSIVGHDPLHQPYSNPLDGTFNNSGTLVVDGALPTIESVNSSGTIDVSDHGYLTLAGNSTARGVINAAGGTTVSFYGSVNTQGHYGPGAATIKPGGAFKGPGFYAVFNGETLYLGANVAPANLLVAGGSVTGPGTLTVTGELEFSG